MQRYWALQAVEPNSETSSVALESHCGHRTCRAVGSSVSGIGPEVDGAGPGGEIPAGANPIWHVLNLEDGVVGDYVDDYGVDGTLEGTYVRHWDDVTKNEWWWNAQTRTFLTGDAEQTIRTKADYVADTGLGFTAP